MQHLNLCPLWNDYVDKFRIGNWYEEPMCYSEPSISYVEEEDNVYYFQPSVRMTVPTNQFWYRSKNHQIIAPTTPESFIGADGQTLEILSHVYDKSLKLNVITLSGEIKELGQNLYYKSEDRGKFRAIYMPDSVETIGEQAFRQIGYGIHMQYSNNLKTLGTKSMTGDGFTDVYLPDSIEYIGPHCFSYSGIQRLRLPNNPNLSCGEQAFVLTWDLYSVLIPDTVTELPKQFLDESAQLQTVKLPSSLSSIGYGAFYGCPNLKTIELNQGLTTLDNYCLALTGLTSAHIPSSVQSVGYATFAWNNSLQEVIIEAGVQSLGEGAFYACPLLTEMTYTGTKIEWEAIAKHTDWALQTPLSVIHCSDGDITL